MTKIIFFAAICITNHSISHYICIWPYQLFEVKRNDREVKKVKFDKSLKNGNFLDNYHYSILECHNKYTIWA